MAKKDDQSKTTERDKNESAKGVIEGQKQRFLIKQAAQDPPGIY
jgi:hypothetical protein